MRSPSSGILLLLVAAAAPAWVVVKAAPAAAAPSGRRTKAARAPEAAAATPPPLEAAALDKLRAALASEDDAAVLTAIDQLARAGDAGAAAPLHEALATGVAPDHASRMLEALGTLRHRDSPEFLLLYSGNRNVKVRLAALRALASYDSPAVTKALHARLGDADADVRAAAAEALASRKDASAVERLLALLSRNDAGAAAPLGQLAPFTLVPQVAELRGRITDAALGTCLGEFLKRPGAPDRLRLDIVRTLGRIPGLDATTALIEFIATLPEADTSPAKQEAQALIDQRGDL